MSYLIADEIRAEFGPMVEKCTAPPGPEPELSERPFFGTVLHWARTDISRRDPPGEFVKWDAVYNRLRR